jgi:AraC family transcriptional regulator, transcriptional activator of pobA
MSRRFRSLLIDRVNLRTPTLHVMKLALHSHLPERDSVEQHTHSSSQALLYLNGEGWQSLSRSKARVEPGTLVMVSPGVLHSFARLGGQVPQCVVIDFRFRHPGRRRTTVSSLSRSELAQVRQSLTTLSRMQAESPIALHSVGAALVLQIMITLLRSAGWLPREIPQALGNAGRAISDLLSKMDPATPLREVIRQSGYQRDHLNSLIKRETGITLGQYRSQQRLSLAKRLLTEQVRVSAVATAAGVPDQSYFARWFRKQTGQPPSSWSRGWR